MIYDKIEVRKYNYAKNDIRIGGTHEKPTQMLHLYPCIHLHAGRWLQLRCAKR